MLIEEEEHGERDRRGERAMLIEENTEREIEGEKEMPIEELLEAGNENRLQKIRSFVKSSGLERLIETYEFDKHKGISLISYFLVLIEIYAHGEGCFLGLRIVSHLLNSVIPRKHHKLYSMVRSSFVHFINCLLLDIHDHLSIIFKKNQLQDIYVDEFLFLMTNPAFLEITATTFQFNFEPLMELSLSVDQFDIILSDKYMTLFHFFHILPKNHRTNVSFLDCMISNVEFIHGLCPHILHTKYDWIKELGFEFRKAFVYSKIEKIDHLKKERLSIDRENLLNDSVQKVLGFEHFMYGVEVFYLHEQGIGDGLLRDWMCSLISKMVNVSDGVAAGGQYTRPFIESETDLSRILPQPGFVLKESNLNSGFFRSFGRVIGLAIMHNIQVGYTFDAVLFRQLAGQPIDVEHIRDACPLSYRIYNDILHVHADHELLEQNIYFLVKFGGDQIDTTKGEKGLLTGEYRDEYVRHAVNLEFVESISDAVCEIRQGLDDVLSYPSTRLFFRALTLGDFDLLLRGLSKLDLEEWRSHTVYEGYTLDDPEIVWFWKCVSELSEEERLELFNFWTATRWLPPGGFGELNPRPLIQMVYTTAEENVDRRHPKAQTCHRSLAFPRYTSIEAMRKILHDVINYYSSVTFENV